MHTKRLTLVLLSAFVSLGAVGQVKGYNSLEVFNVFDGQPKLSPPLSGKFANFRMGISYVRAYDITKSLAIGAGATIMDNDLCEWTPVSPGEPVRKFNHGTHQPGVTAFARARYTLLPDSETRPFIQANIGYSFQFGYKYITYIKGPYSQLQVGAEFKKKFHAALGFDIWNWHYYSVYDEIIKDDNYNVTSIKYNIINDEKHKKGAISVNVGYRF